MKDAKRTILDRYTTVVTTPVGPHYEVAVLHSTWHRVNGRLPRKLAVHRDVVAEGLTLPQARARHDEEVQAQKRITY